MATPYIIATPAGLHKYIHNVWMMTASAAQPGKESLITMADGSPGLIFQHPGSGIMMVGDKVLPPLYLYGQATKWSQLTIKGTVDAVGICFKPSAIPKLFGLRADELTDTCIGIAELPGAMHRRIDTELPETAGVAERVELIAGYLRRLLYSTQYATDAITEMAVQQICETSGSIRLSDLRRELRVSERSLERKFREQVGIPAALFARICRFQESMRQLKEDRFDKLSDIAYYNGYADQSHFIRTFRSFAGCSPNQYRNKSVEIIDSFPLNSSPVLL